MVNDDSQKTAREPRRPFQDAPAPEPFHRSPEFRRFGLIFGFLAVVLVVGLYYANVLERRAAEAEARRAATMLPRTKLGPAEIEARRVELLSKFEGAFSDSENGQDVNQKSSGYHKLLESLIRYSPEDVHAKATRELDILASLADPDAWRGEWVRARGVVGDLWAIKLDRPVLNRTDLYRGLLSDGEHPFFVDLTERDPTLDFTGEAVDVEGLFYRTVRFENRAGQMVEAPQLLVRNMHVVRPAADSGLRALSTTALLTIVGGMALVILFGALVLSRTKARARTRAPDAAHPARANANFQDMFAQRLRREGEVPPPTKPK